MRSPGRLLQGSSFRTFLLYPVVVVTWELMLNKGRLRLEPWFLPLLAWGYLQYRLVGKYRLRLGGGGPGMDTPPERLVTSGPFAWCRNPMYLGHIIFLAGLALSLRSELAALIAIATAIWFQFRVMRDEKRLRERFGQPYMDYSARVKRWVPLLF
ncbi:MAG TPA: isoprenylcysteine carboxylmethyltransferase family protein [Burkholderiales bacterium]|nr:isoprenylcysteine carboxylmethyltransferase family protein [Burkholderiales bacterium]